MNVIHPKYEVTERRQVTALISEAEFRQKLWDRFLLLLKQDGKDVSSFPKACPKDFTDKRPYGGPTGLLSDIAHKFNAAVCELNEQVTSDLLVVKHGWANLFSPKDKFWYTKIPDITVLPNGLAVLPMEASDDVEFGLALLIYWDGSDFRGYIPKNGNPYNHTMGMCYHCDGRPEFMHDGEVDEKDIQAKYGMSYAELYAADHLDWQTMFDELAQVTIVPEAVVHDVISFIGPEAKEPQVKESEKAEASHPFKPLRHPCYEIKNPREVTELIDIPTFRQKLWALFVERAKRAEANILADEQMPPEVKEKFKKDFFSDRLPEKAPETFTIKHLQHIDGGHLFCRALPGIAPTIYNDMSEASHGDGNVYLEGEDMPPLTELENGVVVMPCLGGDTEEICVATLVYWDGDKFRAYTPQNGNPWNHETNMCFRCRQYDTSVTRENDKNEAQKTYGMTPDEMANMTRKELYDWQAMLSEFVQATTVINKEDDKLINIYIESLTAMEFTVQELAEYGACTHTTPTVNVFAALVAAGYGDRHVVAKYEKSKNIVVNEVRIRCCKDEVWAIGKVVMEAGGEMAPQRYSMKDGCGIFMAGPEKRFIS